MMIRVFPIHAVVPVLLSCLALGSAMPAGPPDKTFTIKVAAPTPAKQVQVILWLTDGSGTEKSSVITRTHDNRIVIKEDAKGNPARTFKAIAFAPGCQFVTISVDDLAASSRQGDFQCQKLTVTHYTGGMNVSRFGSRKLKVDVYYRALWAGQFFGEPGLSGPGFVLAKAKVQADGSFNVEIPDFSADPLWQSLSKDAILQWSLMDARSGKTVAVLREAGAAQTFISPYPEIEFSIQPRIAATSTKN